MRTMLTVSCVCLAAIVTPTAVIAQFPPDSLVNLKVFPKDTPVRELIGHMRGFSFALGVRCQYCHVGEEGQPLASFDFVSDEKRTKQAARVMLEMVDAINGSHLTHVPERPAPSVEVSCATCHRGLPRPRFLQDVLAETLERDGLQASIAQYRQLRETYYGSGSYDFSEMTLLSWADNLARSRKLDEATGILELNAELYPNSAGTYFSLGDVFRIKGDSVTAMTHYDKALSLEPRLRQQVDRALQMMRRP